MDNNMSILFISDICFRDKEEIMDRKFAEHILQPIQKELKKADFRIANLENQLASEDICKPIEKVGAYVIGRPKNVGFFEEAGIDCAILANNHMGDYGEKATISTLDVLKLHQISHVGAGRNLDEAYTPWRVSKNGISVSVIAVCENEFGIATETTPGSAGFNLLRITNAILHERQVSDYVFLVYHGGNEHNPLPSPGVVERFHLLCDVGADAVIGMHTHCPQGFELYKGKPIVYSMGNFYFHNATDEGKKDSWYTGYMCRLDLYKAKNIEMSIIPYQFNKDCSRIVPMDGIKKEKMMTYLKRLNSIINDPEHLKKLYQAWCERDGKAKGYFIDPLFYGEDYDRIMLLRMKNRIICEAFREILMTSIMMLIHHDFPVDPKWHNELDDLIKMPVEPLE